MTAATARRRTPTRSRLVASLPDARLVTTDGLGHRRILKDRAVVREVAAFVVGEELRAGAA